MKKMLIFAMAVLFAGLAQAQIVSSKNSRITTTKGPSAPIEGYNRLYIGYASMILTGDDVDDDEDNINGVKLGFLHGIGLTQTLPLFLEIGGELQFNARSETAEHYYGDVTSKDRLLALTIPVNLTYKFSFNNGFYLAPYAGLNLRVNLMGKTKEVDEDDDESETYSWFNKDEMDPTANRAQFGGQFGLNAGYKAFNFNIGYQLNSALFSDDDYKIKTNFFTVGVGVNF